MSQKTTRMWMDKDGEYKDLRMTVGERELARTGGKARKRRGGRDFDKSGRRAPEGRRN